MVNFTFYVSASYFFCKSLNLLKSGESEASLMLEAGKETGNHSPK